MSGAKFKILTRKRLNQFGPYSKDDNCMIKFHNMYQGGSFALLSTILLQ